jgi:hypothetical protein
MRHQKRKYLLKWLLGVVAFTMFGGFTSLAVGESDSTTGQVTTALPPLVLSRTNRSAKPFRGRGDKCVVEPTSKMRIHHFEYILDQRDKTVHKGIRTKQFKLQRCVNCHADPKTNSVLGKNGFCQQCHEYTAVRADCFSCHTDKATTKSTANKKPSKGAK